MLGGGIRTSALLEKTPIILSSMIINGVDFSLRLVSLFRCTVAARVCYGGNPISTPPWERTPLRGLPVRTCTAGHHQPVTHELAASTHS